MKTSVRTKPAVPADTLTFAQIQGKPGVYRTYNSGSQGSFVFVSNDDGQVIYLSSSRHNFAIATESDWCLDKFIAVSEQVTFTAQN